MGEEIYAGALAQHHALIRAALVEHHGNEIDTQGDSFFAVFDSTRECVKAVIDMQRALEAEPWPAGERVRVRMGVHSGEASETSAGLVGFDVHRAARVAAIAHGGQVLLSSSAVELVRDFLPEGASLRDLGEHRLKDLGRPEQIFQLRAEGLPDAFPPVRSLDSAELPNNLPAQLASFVGRERELADVRSLVESNRLVTLTGAGGSGKTRLALQVAAEMLDGSGEGVWLVDLAPVSDEDAVASTIVDVLGIARRSDRSSIDKLVESLGPQRALILLDNCEHLIGGCAKVADAILRRCPQIYLLATSREPLGITGETIYRVPSLSLPADDQLEAEKLVQHSDAVALFVDRAHAQGAILVLDDESAPLVAQICKRLDGMPLAIELAVPRLRALSLANLHDRLDQRFRLLTGGSRNALPRQQTLLATVDWSFSLLNEPEKQLLRRLSVFLEGFTLEAAEAVGGLVDVFAITDLLASLVDKSLVVAEPSSGEFRYRLLETIRQFALEKLEEAGGSEAVAVRAAHCGHFLALVEAAESELRGRDQVRWYPRLDTEQANIHYALEFAGSDPDVVAGTTRVLRFAAALMEYWSVRRRSNEAIAIVVPVLSRPEAHFDPALRCAALVSAGVVLRSSDISLSLRLLEEAMDLARKVGDEGLIIDAESMLSAAYYFAGNPEKGFPIGEEAVDRARRMGDPHRLEFALSMFLLSSDRVQPERTLELSAEAVACNERTGNVAAAALLHNNAGVYQLRQGDLEAARQHLQQSHEAMVAIGEEPAIWGTNMGWVLREGGDTPGAVSEFERSLRSSRRSRDTNNMSYAMLGLACAQGDLAEWRRAAVLHGFADAKLATVGEPWQNPEDRYRQRSVARVRAELGDGDFERAYTEGSVMDEKSAVDLALGRM